MQRKSKFGVDWLEFDHLQGLCHGVMLRRGGVSLGSRAALNLGFEGDVEEHVCENLKRVQQCLQMESIHYPTKQLHGINIVEVCVKSFVELPNCDALMTCEPGVPLMVRHADCQAAIFFDPIKAVLAVAHCGWRGSVQNIYSKVVEAMEAKHNCRPKDLLVGISPSLGPQAAEFVNYRRELPESFWQYQAAPNYFDFWAISQNQLQACGIKEENIEIARICTYADTENYFSYRRHKQTGRHGTVACMR